MERMREEAEATYARHPTVYQSFPRPLQMEELMAMAKMAAAALMVPGARERGDGGAEGSCGEQIQAPDLQALLPLRPLRRSIGDATMCVT